MCNIMDVLNYVQQYSFNDCYWLLYNRYTECDSREDIPVESVSDSSHILINSLRYNVISSNLMKIRSLLFVKILIIIKITPFTLASKFGQLYSAEWYICLCIQGPICCSYNRHSPLVLSVFKPPFYTVLGYVSTGSTTVLLLSNIITSGFVLFRDTTSLSVKWFYNHIVINVNAPEGP